MSYRIDFTKQAQNDIDFRLIYEVIEEDTIVIVIMAKEHYS